MSRQESLSEPTQAYLHTHIDCLQLTILKCLVFAIQYGKNKRMIHKTLPVWKIKFICECSSSRSHSREIMENSLTTGRYKLLLRRQNEPDPTMVHLKLNSKNPPTLNCDNQALELLYAASPSSVLALEKTHPPLHSLVQSLFCNASPGFFERHSHVWCLQLVIFPLLCTSHFQSNSLLHGQE